MEEMYTVLAVNVWDTCCLLTDSHFWYCEACSAWFVEEATYIHDRLIEQMHLCPLEDELQAAGLTQNALGVWF
jgi:hypothetical protein